MLLLSTTNVVSAITMVMVTCPLSLHCTKVVEEDDDEAFVFTGVQDIGITDFQQSYNENQKLLVFLYRLDCDTCPQILDSLAKIVERPELPSGVSFVKSFNNELLTKLDITQVPSVVYLRDKSYVIYDGNLVVEDLLRWVQKATNKITHRLDDETFPVLYKTDASKTTDDWLVIFYKETCKSALPVIETFGVRVHGQVKVAKVNIMESPRLTFNLEITECPEIIFFKDGKLYKYQSEVVDTGSLKTFVTESYQSAPSYAIPEISSDTGFIKDITAYIKRIWRSDDQRVLVAGLSLLGFLLLVYIVCRCCCCPSKKHRRKKTKKQ